MDQVRRVSEHGYLYARMRMEQFYEALDAQIGTSEFAIDHLAGRLDFLSDRGTVSARSHLLASIAVEPATLLWGYAQAFASSVGSSPVPSLIMAFGAAHGLDEFSTPELAYKQAGSSGSREEVDGLVHVLGPAGIEIAGPTYFYYTYRTGSAGSRHLVLFDQPTLEVPNLDIATVMVKLPRLLGEVRDIGWALDGLARLAGFGLHAERQGDANRTGRYRLADGSHQIDVEVETDELGRVTRVRVSGPHGPASGPVGS